MESSNAESKDGSLWGEICRLRVRPESRRKGSQRRNQWTRTTLGVPINAQDVTRALPFDSTTRLMVYDVMTQIDPAALESRGKVGQKKQHRGPTGTFTSLVRYLLVPFFTGSRKTHYVSCFASVLSCTYNMRAKHKSNQTHMR